jgi:hypothetical protein
LLTEIWKEFVVFILVLHLADEVIVTGKLALFNKTLTPKPKNACTSSQWGSVFVCNMEIKIMG